MRCLPQIFVALLVLLNTFPSMAWKGVAEACGSVKYAPGNSMTFQIVAGDFTAAEEVAIQQAADAWDASGSQYPGADWGVIISSTSAISVDYSNGINEIGVVDFTNLALKDIGFPKSARKELTDEASELKGFAQLRLSCFSSGIRETDIILNSDRTLDDGSWLDGDVTGDLAVLYVGVTVAHEIGHAIGFGHDSPDVNLMDGYGSANATFPDVPALDEDDARGLRTVKPSTCVPVAGVESCMRVAVSPWHVPVDSRKAVDFNAGNGSGSWMAQQVGPDLGAAREALSYKAPATQTPIDMTPLVASGATADLAFDISLEGRGVPRFINLGDRTTDWFHVKFYLIPSSSEPSFSPPFEPTCEDYIGHQVWSHRRMRLGVGQSYHRMPSISNAFVRSLSAGDYRVCVEADTSNDLHGDNRDDNVWVLDRLLSRP